MPDCTLIWDFLEHYPFSQLTVHNVRDFLAQQPNVELKYHIHLQTDIPKKDMDLFLRLFAELGEVLKNTPVQDDFSKHDQIFDIFMSVADQYACRRKIIQYMLRDLMFMPSHMLEARKRGARLANQIFTTLGIQTCVINLNHINVLATIFGEYGQAFELPKAMHEQTFFMFCLYFLKIWVDDESPMQEDTMQKLNTALNFVRMT